MGRRLKIAALRPRLFAAAKAHTPRHLPSLDGLRAVAVLLVLWEHVPLNTPDYPVWLVQAKQLVGPGGLGVELFFALSGFLITRILIAERERSVPVRWFLLRRLLRIFPIYYLLLGILAWTQSWPSIAWGALYLRNFADVFAPVPDPLPLSHTWSLCVEEHFYLLWPLVVAFCPKAAGPRVLTWFVVPAAVVGALLVCLTCGDQRDWIIERLSPFRFLTLAAGALAAYAEPRLSSSSSYGPLRVGVLLTLLGLAIHPFLWFVLIPYGLEVGYWPIHLMPVAVRLHTAIFCTGVLLWCLARRGRFGSPHVLLTAWPLRAIGRISYGLYLYHMPIYALVLMPEPAGAKVWQAVGWTFLAATASYWVLERPILRYAARFRWRQSPA